LDFDGVCQFHQVVKITGVIAAADLQDIHQAVMGAGDRLEPEQALELTLEMFGALETLAMDDLRRTQRPDGVAPQPDLTVAAAANDLK